MTSASPGSDPWPLLRKRPFASVRSNLRLVVHGRSGGSIPACLRELASELKDCRDAPVQLESLTAEHPPEPLGGHTWLIPLLLLPGAHVCDDLPAIRSRLRSQGLLVQQLPFLGAWSRWWSLVIDDLQESSLVPVHHPLRPGRADRFLESLRYRLGRPLISFDAWTEHQRLHPHSRPYPLTLAPNRMVESLGEAPNMPTLLERPRIRQGLIELLVELP